MSRVSSQYMLLIAEFVVDLLDTERMSEAEYREFIVATLESLSVRFGERLGRGLARAATEEMRANYAPPGRSFGPGRQPPFNQWPKMGRLEPPGLTDTFGP